MRRVPAAAPYLALLFLLAVPGFSSGQETPTLDLPALLTSCGQSPGPVRLKVFMDRLKLDFEYDMVATAELLKARKADGRPIRTVIIVTGASLKGMGAAGIEIEDEIDRIQALIIEAKAQGATIVGAHVEGMTRRAQGAAPGDNSDELSIDAVCPEADVLLVKKEGNEDGRFTTISLEKGIPLVQFDQNMEMMDVLKRLFGG